MSGDLIETLWNVKSFKHEGKTVRAIDLVETLWNVKTENAETKGDTVKI